jgi:hypothetical protein
MNRFGLDAHDGPRAALVRDATAVRLLEYMRAMDGIFNKSGDSNGFKVKWTVQIGSKQS